MDKKNNTLLKTLKIIWDSSPFWTVLRFLLSIVNLLLPLLTIFLFKEIIDQIALSEDDLGAGMLEKLYPYIGLWLLISLASGLTVIFIKYVTEVHNFKLSVEVQRRIHIKAREIPYAFFDSHKYYDVFHRAQKESNSKPQKLVEDFSSLLGNAFVIIGVLGILASLDYWIPLLILAIGVPAIWSRRKYAKELYNHTIKTTSSDRMSSHLSKVLTQQSFASELRIFGQHRSIQTFFERLKEEIFKRKLKIVKAYVKIGSISALLETGLFIFFIAYTSTQLIGGFITIGSFVMYFQAFQKGQSSSLTLFGRLMTIYESKLFLGNIFHFLELPSEEESKVIKHPINKIKSLVMKDVFFNYPNEERAVLKSIEFEANRGELIGVVGENGSGKSTLMKLISGFYPPQKGDFLINDMPIEDIGLEHYRQNVSIVSQEYSRYFVNAGFNISYQEDSWDEERIMKSIKLADLSSLINGLEQGLNTRMSRAFAKGKELSGGQWQKFALARAIYKEAQIIVLDEPTSHIDGASTIDFFRKMKTISKDKIIFIVTHQIANLSQCDKIWVMKEGEFVEKGDLNWLIKHSESFLKMFGSQIVS